MAETADAPLRPGDMEYGAVQHPVAFKRRSCGVFFAGPDWPPLLLPWLIFAVILCTLSLGSPLLLCVLAALYGLSLSGALAYFSAGRGSPWMLFSAICGIASVAGIVLGATLRTEGRRAGGTIAALFICLLLVLALSRALPALRCRLVGSSASFAERQGWGWNPTAAAKMAFGCGGRSVADALMEDREGYPEKVSLDLLRHRCYWSGEPGYDYIFHLANEHSFLGCALAHPANPFEKFERMLVLLIISFLIVFPVAAFSCGVHNPVLRAILVLLLVTIPRNLLRWYLKRIVIADDEILLRAEPQQQQQQQQQQSAPQQLAEASQTPERRAAGRWQAAVKSSMRERLSVVKTWQEAATKLRVTNALCWEAAFFSIGLVFAAVVCLLSCLHVKAHASTPVGIVILESCNGLLWAFVLELIFDLLIAHRPPDRQRNLEEAWFLGFFHRWRQERDEYIKRPAD